MRFDFTDPEFRRDPWPAYRELRRAGGVTFSPETGTYLVTSHSGVKAGLTHPDLAADYPLRSSRTLFGPNMLDTDGALHRTLKRLVNPFFGASSVNRLIPSLIEPVVEATVAEVAASTGPIDFIDAVARRVPYLIMTSLMGIPVEDSEWLYRTIRPVVAALDYPPPPDRSPAQQARDELNKYFLEQLDVRRHGEAVETIIGQLAGMVRTDALTRAHALSSVLLMLVAGTETSISGISNIMHCALRWPAEAGEFPVQSVVKESLRWEPPLHSVLRFAARELTVDGVIVQRKRPVLLVIASANRDEAVFPEPDRFDPGRNFRQTMQFGVGSHACPGSYLAEREFTILFTALRDNVRLVPAERPPDIVGHVFRRAPTLPVLAASVASAVTSRAREHASHPQSED